MLVKLHLYWNGKQSCILYALIQVQVHARSLIKNKLNIIGVLNNQQFTLNGCPGAKYIIMQVLIEHLFCSFIQGSHIISVGRIICYPKGSKLHWLSIDNIT